MKDILNDFNWRKVADMASILVVSRNGDGIPLALRMASDGHIVKVWIKSHDAKSLLDGFKNPSKVNDPYKMVDQYDLILNDMVGTGAVCDNLSAKGKLVIGGGSFSDKLELDKEYSGKVARTVTGAKIAPTTIISTKKELITYLNGVSQPQVIDHSAIDRQA